MIHARERQSQKALDAALHRFEGSIEGGPFLIVAALDRRGIWNPPMGARRPAEPDRARFAGGVVTNRDDKIEMRTRRRGKLIPAFAAQSLGWKIELPQELESERIYRTTRMTTRAEGVELPFSQTIENGFGEDAAR